MAGAIAQERCARPDELVTIKTPWTYNVKGDSYHGPIYVVVHRAVAPRLRLAMIRASNFSRFGRADLVERIDSFNCRPIRGGEEISWHGKGAAIDIFATNPTTPPPGGVWTPDKTFGHDFAACFTDLGFTWGRNWSRRDDPHLEWRSATVPKITLTERRRTRRLAKRRWDRGR